MKKCAVIFEGVEHVAVILIGKCRIIKLAKGVGLLQQVAGHALVVAARARKAISVELILGRLSVRQNTSLLSGKSLCVLFLEGFDEFDLLVLFELILDEGGGLVADHEVELDGVAHSEINVLFYHHALQVQWVDHFRAQRAGLPRACFLEVQVLQHAWPAEDMTTLGDARTNHLLEVFHADGAPDCRRAVEVVDYLHDIPPRYFCVCTEELR